MLTFSHVYCEAFPSLYKVLYRFAMAVRRGLMPATGAYS